MDITNLMSCCALRFDGYRFEDDTKTDLSMGPGSLLSEYAEPIVKTLRLHADNLLNFGAFFILQRSLHKWGGEYLTKYSEEHIAYDFLFLHLYSHEVPEPYAASGRINEWRSFDKDQIEAAALFVRSSFQRKGKGKTILV